MGLQLEFHFHKPNKSVPPIPAGCSTLWQSLHSSTHTSFTATTLLHIQMQRLHAVQPRHLQSFVVVQNLFWENWTKMWPFVSEIKKTRFTIVHFHTKKPIKILKNFYSDIQGVSLTGRGVSVAWLKPNQGNYISLLKGPAMRLCSHSPNQWMQ